MDISGTYHNRGQDAPDNKDADIHRQHPQYLSHFFVADTMVNHRKHRWIQHIKIRGVSQQQLHVQMHKQQKLIQHITLQQDKHFICTEQGIVLTSSFSPSNPMAIYKRTTNLLLRKADDGALLVSEKNAEAGVVFFLLAPVPFSGSDTQHYRFPRVADAP